MEGVHNSLVCCHQLRIGEILGSCSDQVPVLGLVQNGILIHSLLGLEAEIQRIVSVDDSGGHIRKHGGDGVRCQLLDGHIHAVALDILQCRIEAVVLLQGDDAGIGQNLQGSSLIGEVVRHCDGVAVLQLIQRGNLLGIYIQRDNKGVADVLDLVAVVFDLGIEINLMLEGVEVDFAVVQCIVRRHIIRELHDLEFNALLLQLVGCRLPEILVDGAHHTELHGNGILGEIIGACLALCIGCLCCGFGAGCCGGRLGLCRCCGCTRAAAACAQYICRQCGADAQCQNLLFHNFSLLFLKSTCSVSFFTVNVYASLRCCRQ